MAQKNNSLEYGVDLNQQISLGIYFFANVERK